MHSGSSQYWAYIHMYCIFMPSKIIRINVLFSSLGGALFDYIWYKDIPSSSPPIELLLCKVKWGIRPSPPPCAAALVTATPHNMTSLHTTHCRELWCSTAVIVMHGAVQHSHETGRVHKFHMVLLLSPAPCPDQGSLAKYLSSRGRSVVSPAQLISFAG